MEAKLKEMRKPEYGDRRVVAFIDVDDGEWRWTLLEDLEEIASSEEFSSSFRPSNTRIPLRVSYSGESSGEVIVTPDTLSDDLLDLLPAEIRKLTVRAAHITPDIDNEKVTYYYVPRRAVRLLILNAATYMTRADSW